MKLLNFKRSLEVMILSTSLITAHLPMAASAQVRMTRLPLSFFPIDNADDDTTEEDSSAPTFPESNGKSKNNGISNRPSMGNGSTVGSIGGGNGFGRPQQGNGRNTMYPARVPLAYSCPLFVNQPLSDLMIAIDSMDKEIKTSDECKGSASAQTIETNGNTIKRSVESLKKLLQTQDPASVNVGEIEQSVTAALNAIGSIGDTINNNTFLNSKCGSQTMSNGKVLLAMNEVINGFTPYALYAVSMNAALNPALPFVVGGAVASSGISALSKMLDQDSSLMTNPEYRKAVLQNTCQFTKISKKVRFMQLAQSGKIDQLTQEMEKNITLYSKTNTKLAQDVSKILSYRAEKKKSMGAIEDQLARDNAEFSVIDEQSTHNNDDFMVCTLANELVNWGRDGKSFPHSAFKNLEAAAAFGDRSQKILSATLKTLNINSISKIQASARKAGISPNHLKTCADTGRYWIAGIRQAMNVTSTILNNKKNELEAELSKNNDYNDWVQQNTYIKTEKATIKRFEKAMLELAKDNSIIDRSELSQRMADLKAGLFGSRSAWTYSAPPVLSWIKHTKKMYDQSVATFSAEAKSLHEESYSLTTSGRKQQLQGKFSVDPRTQYNSLLKAKALGSLSLHELQKGTREHELICQQLDNAWLGWSAAIDHLGAIEFFCDMIDSSLDAQINSDIIRACRGDIKLNGAVFSNSLVKAAKETLTKKGYQAEAQLISTKIKELQCPNETISKNDPVN